MLKKTLEETPSVEHPGNTIDQQNVKVEAHLDTIVALLTQIERFAEELRQQ